MLCGKEDFRPHFLTLTRRRNGVKRKMAKNAFFSFFPQTTKLAAVEPRR